jgi:hypothetical protein
VTHKAVGAGAQRKRGRRRWRGSHGPMAVTHKAVSAGARIRMAVLPTGTRGYPTLLGKGTGIEFYPQVRVRV